MIFLGNLVKVAEGNYKVGLQNPFPETIPEIYKSSGIVVDELPPKVEIDGKSTMLHCNPVTKELWYEYEDVQKSEGQLLLEEMDLQTNYVLDLDFRLSKIELGL